jgi:hypothetical protein
MQGQHQGFPLTVTSSPKAIATMMVSPAGTSPRDALTLDDAI